MPPPGGIFFTMVSKKDDIVVVARELFTQYGFSKTTMSDIAEAAGISKASLYYYFTNKTDVFASVYNTMAAVADAELKKALAQVKPAADKILRCLESWGAHHEQVRLIGFYNLNPQLGAQFMPVVEAVWQMRLKTLSDIISRGIATNEFILVDSEAAAQTILNCVIGIVCNLSTTNSENYTAITPQEIAVADSNVRFFLAIFLRGLAANQV